MITRTWAFTVQPGYHQCPVCNAAERACHVFEAGGYRHVKCFRASCNAYARFGLQDLGGGRYQGSPSQGIAAPRASQEVLRPFLGHMYPLDAYPKAHIGFRDRFGFAGKGVYVTDYAPFPLLIPILSPSGGLRGHVEKRGALFPGEQKSNRIWKSKHEPMISWANLGPDNAYMETRTVWLVEDQISALKLAARGIRAVALLGTNITLEALSEIQKQADSIVIALDADATAKAFILARKYGSAFKSCQVKILTKDIKDDSAYNSAPSGEVKPFNGNAHRCAHGVWMGDRCYKCDPPQSDAAGEPNASYNSR